MVIGYSRVFGGIRAPGWGEHTCQPLALPSRFVSLVTESQRRGEICSEECRTTYFALAQVLKKDSAAETIKLVFSSLVVLFAGLFHSGVLPLIFCFLWCFSSAGVFLRCSLSAVFFLRCFSQLVFFSAGVSFWCFSMVSFLCWCFSYVVLSLLVFFCFFFSQLVFFSAVVFSLVFCVWCCFFLWFFSLLVFFFAVFLCWVCFFAGGFVCWCVSLSGTFRLPVFILC